MEGNLEDFVNWTKLKIRLHLREDIDRVYFREKEIWWISVGKNIGHEQDGKNENFERPVVVIKKFNKELAWIAPTTTQKKKNKLYYFDFKYNDESMSIILSQVKLISTRRFLRKVGIMNKIDFERMKNKLKSLL